jgi:EAL domain-containing protein (putative c-di-GMP-specific phosphodiesterase class I)
MEHAERAVDILGPVHALGVQLAVDDFGTGYSSLAYLQRFPVQTLKIDRSFVHDLVPGGAGESIVTAIIAMAHGLNMTVTAEGVETAAQLALLEKLACDEIQGYLLGRPAPPGELAGVLRS